MAKKKTPSKKPKGATSRKPKAAKEPSKLLPKIERFQRALRVDLSEKEVQDAADRAAICLAEHDGKLEQLKADTEHAKAKIKDLAAELRRLSNMVRERATTRPVECEKRFDYETKKVRDTRLDTGETLFERAMTDAELQPDLPFLEIDDEFDDAADPGDGIGDAAEANSKAKKKPKEPKDEPKEPETEPDPSEIDDDVEDNDGEPEAAE